MNVWTAFMAANLRRPGAFTFRSGSADPDRYLRSGRVPASYATQEPAGSRVGGGPAARASGADGVGGGEAGGADRRVQAGEAADDQGDE